MSAAADQVQDIVFGGGQGNASNREGAAKSRRKK